LSVCGYFLELLVVTIARRLLGAAGAVPVLCVIVCTCPPIVMVPVRVVLPPFALTV
jgi:hypothetical protein